MDDIIVINEIFTSSSSSESSDEALDIFNDNYHRRRRIPRLQNYVENIVVRYNDVEFKENFRLSRGTFEYLLYLIRPDIEGKIYEFGPMPIAPEKQLYIALWVLGTSDSYRSVTTKFGIGRATAWRCVKRVVKALCALRNYFIRWPSAAEARETSMRIMQKRHSFPGVIGAVDGTHIHIAAPKIEPQAYINRKGVHSIQLQNSYTVTLDCLDRFMT